MDQTTTTRFKSQVHVIETWPSNYKAGVQADLNQYDQLKDKAQKELLIRDVFNVLVYCKKADGIRQNYREEELVKQQELMETLTRTRRKYGGGTGFDDDDPFGERPLR